MTIPTAETHPHMRDIHARHVAAIHAAHEAAVIAFTFARDASERARRGAVVDALAAEVSDLTGRTVEDARGGERLARTQANIAAARRIMERTCGRCHAK